jgi:hypothetical protein
MLAAQTSCTALLKLRAPHCTVLSQNVGVCKAFFLDLAHPIDVINCIMQPAATHYVVAAPTHTLWLCTRSAYLHID